MFQSLFNRFKRATAKKVSKDPVCGMHVSDSITMVYKGQVYAFCSDHCKQQFEKNPEAYITK